VPIDGGLIGAVLTHLQYVRLDIAINSCALFRIHLEKYEASYATSFNCLSIIELVCDFEKNSDLPKIYARNYSTTLIALFKVRQFQGHIAPEMLRSKTVVSSGIKCF
jgi:hypothetical protein